MTMFRRFTTATAVALPVTVALSVPAHASYADITGAVSSGEVITGLFAIGAVIGAILAIRMGVRKVLGMIR